MLESASHTADHHPQFTIEIVGNTVKITKRQLQRIIHEAILLEKKGLWDNVHKKRKEGRPPAKPGDEGYPDEEAWKAAQESDDPLDEAIMLAVFEAKKQINKDRMKCDKPRYLRKGETGHGDKQKVVKACDDGKEKIIRFGDANMENKSDDPDSKKNFRSRHNCKDKKDQMTAGYWACKDW